MDHLPDLGKRLWPSVITLWFVIPVNNKPNKLNCGLISVMFFVRYRYANADNESKFTERTNQNLSFECSAVQNHPNIYNGNKKLP